MSTPGAGGPTKRWAPWANLLLPGSGMILTGSLASGLVGGVLFAACANFAVLAVLLFPDDFSGTVQALAIGLAAGAYVGAQVRFVGRVRELRAQAATSLRRQHLWKSQALLAQGDVAHAVELLQPLAAQAPDDLLVAYRLAQALTAGDDVPAARAAWRQVRQLDRHALYKQQIRENEDRLRAL